MRKTLEQLLKDNSISPLEYDRREMRDGGQVVLMLFETAEDLLQAYYFVSRRFCCQMISSEEPFTLTFVVPPNECEAVMD
jgi:hypothetical protein